MFSKWIGKIAAISGAALCALLAQETLEAKDYFWLGESIRKLGIPTFSLLEGGYSRDLPELVLAYLKGLEGK